MQKSNVCYSTFDKRAEKHFMKGQKRNSKPTRRYNNKLAEVKHYYIK